MAVAAVTSVARSHAFRGHQTLVGGYRRYSVWQAPSCDCYALIGVQPAASAADIKAAYLLKAKAAHPDTAGTNGDSSKMARLNICYEALTRKRSEYDSAKGIGGSGPRSSAYAANREPWWKSKEAAEDFADFGMDWEDVFYGRARGSPGRSGSPHQRPQQRRGGGDAGQANWKEWAETWRAEHQASAQQRGGRSQPRRRGKRRGWDVDEDEDSDDSAGEPFRRGRKSSRNSFWSDSDDDADEFRASASSSSKGRGKGGGRRSRPWQSGEAAPSEIWIAAPPGGRHTGERWERLAGQFSLMEERMNGRAAYAKTGNRSVYLFWSKEYGDWKLAERLEDDGTCLAFAEDQRGKHEPWLPFAPRWKLWDPTSKRFVLRRLSIVGCVEDASAAGAEAQGGEGNDDENIPWARPPWSRWSTADLIRWCKRQEIDVQDCFDRESVLERCISAAARATESSGGSRSSRNGEDSEDSDEEGAHHSARRGRRKGAATGGRQQPQAGVVRVASRVKTDGSYTRPASLDKRVKLYGNRVERFYGPENDIIPWLYDQGDKSRLYTVFYDAGLGYSLCWKKGKYWGRAAYKEDPRQEPDFW